MKLSNLSLSMMGLLLMLSSLQTMAATKVSPETVDGATTISTAEAKRLFDQGVAFLDVRSNRDWEAGRIPGALHIELKKKLNEESMAELFARDRPIVIYCNSTGCTRSSKASEKAVSWGYKKVYYYRLGFPDWKHHGYAIQ
ncbi:MAG: rhodanese-like domain-containing protein [Gammaproteobacteria bacterium]|nr:rhodanese-like domain-containing protein [Gammaproteobacteria bacterium]